MKLSPRFSKSNLSIHTFDYESPISPSNQQSTPNRWLSLNNKSPPSIIKEMRNLASNSPISITGPKRHRPGIVGSYRFSDSGMGLRERRAKISQLNMELIHESENEWRDSPSPAYKTGRKVQFDNFSHSIEVKTPTVKIKRGKKCGRDSGIEMGFDNPNCLEDLSSEDDYLW